MKLEPHIESIFLNINSISYMTKRQKKELLLIVKKILVKQKGKLGSKIAGSEQEDDHPRPKSKILNQTAGRLKSA